jgi:hypothetical protein
MKTRIYKSVVRFLAKASGAMKQTANAQQQFASQLQSNYATQFAGQSAILNSLQKAFLPILQAGPGQAGFTPQEEAAIRTNATETSAAEYRKAAGAAAAASAAQGGGNAFLPNGASQQTQAEIATAGAAQNAAAQNAITQKNYDIGRQNFENAASVLGGTAQMFNPTGYAGQGNTAENEAFSDESAINAANNQWMTTLGGVLGGAASGFGSGYASTLGKKVGGGNG